MHNTEGLSNPEPSPVHSTQDTENYTAEAETNDEEQDEEIFEEELSREWTETDVNEIAEMAMIYAEKTFYHRFGFDISENLSIHVDYESYYEGDFRGPRAFLDIPDIRQIDPSKIADWATVALFVAVAANKARQMFDHYVLTRWNMSHANPNRPRMMFSDFILMLLCQAAVQQKHPRAKLTASVRGLWSGDHYAGRYNWKADYEVRVSASRKSYLFGLDSTARLHGVTLVEGRRELSLDVGEWQAAIDSLAIRPPHSPRSLQEALARRELTQGRPT